MKTLSLKRDTLITSNDMRFNKNPIISSVSRVENVVRVSRLAIPHNLELNFNRSRLLKIVRATIFNYMTPVSTSTIPNLLYDLYARVEMNSSEKSKRKSTKIDRQGKTA